MECESPTQRDVGYSGRVNWCRDSCNTTGSYKDPCATLYLAQSVFYSTEGWCYNCYLQAVHLSATWRLRFQPSHEVLQSASARFLRLQLKVRTLELVEIVTRYNKSKSEGSDNPAGRWNTWRPYPRWEETTLATGQAATGERNIVCGGRKNNNKSKMPLLHYTYYRIYR